MFIRNLFDRCIHRTGRTSAVTSPVQKPRVSSAEQVSDTFDFNISKGLKKLKDFSVEEYKTLTNDELQSLRTAHEKLSSKDSLELEAIQEECAENMKKHLDEMYGENKYSVITIGRSVSSIGKVLGYKIGEENVINIPMSDAGQYTLDFYTKNLEKKGSIKKFRKFLAEKGLEKDKIENSDRKYIVVDFCKSGISLEGAHSLLSRDDLLGKSIIPMNIKDCMDEDFYHSTMEECFCAHKMKEYSFVKQATDLDEIPTSYVDTQKEKIQTRLGWFALLDNAMSKTTKNDI